MTARIKVIIALTVVAVIGCVVARVMPSAFSEMEVASLKYVNASPACVEILGQPISLGTVTLNAKMLGISVAAPIRTTGNISGIGDGSRAKLEIPIHGPKGSALLYVQAHYGAGSWIFGHVELELTNGVKMVVGSGQ